MPSPLDELRQLNVKKQRENTAKAEERDADEAASDLANNTVSHITSNTVSPSADLQTDRPASQPTDKPYDLSASQSINQSAGGLTDLPTYLPASRPSDKQTDRQADKPASRPPDVRSRLKDISSSSMTPVTLKLPEGINAYVDEYIHDNWKQKIKKQDIIKRAMLLAIYELETGKELVKLDV